MSSRTTLCPAVQGQRSLHFWFRYCENLEEIDQHLQTFVDYATRYPLIMCATRPAHEHPSVAQALQNALIQVGYLVTCIDVQPELPAPYYRDKTSTILDLLTQATINAAKAL